MYNIIAIFTIFLALANGQVINQCIRNPGVLPQTASMVGCASPPCEIRNGRQFEIRMTFRAPRPLNNMLTLATSYMNLGNAILPTQINLGAGANACNAVTNRRCPIPQGELVELNLRLTITGMALMHILPVEFRVVDHGPMLCVMIPIRATG